MGFRIFDLISLVGTRDPGINDNCDKENIVKLNYITQLYVKQLVESKDERVNKKALQSISFGAVSTCYLPYMTIPFMLQCFHQHKVFVIGSALIGAYMGFRSQKAQYHNAYTSLLLKSSHLLDPSFLRAYEQRDSRYILDLLPKELSINQMKSELKWQYKLF